MKSDLSQDEQEEVLIQELVSYFDRNTFKVVYRKYIMQYDYWLIDLNVTVDVEMGYAQDKLIPSYINLKDIGTYLLASLRLLNLSSGIQILKLPTRSLFLGG